MSPSSSCFNSPASLALMPPEGTARDTSAHLLREAGHLAGLLPAQVRRAVGDMVRSMNCYYSNLIEGHDTLPRDIERAMRADYSTETTKRNLQLEARAHIEVQALIDHGDLDALGLGEDLIRAIHREFCTRLPDELLWVTHPGTGERLPVVPGEYRQHDVVVGQHEPVSPEFVPAFMSRLADGFDPKRIRYENAVVAAAASHHRLLWVHPFLDGNGRVARLFAHAYLRRAKVGCDLWSVSRGLARSVKRYTDALDRADFTPQGQLDGRGTLSDSGLAAFCGYFVETCLDQVRFMNALLDPVSLMNRMRTFVQVEAATGRLDARVGNLLVQALAVGEVAKSDTASLIGVQERQARRLLDPLVTRGILVSDGKFAPWRLAFPLDECEALFPRLFAPVGVPDVTPVTTPEDEWGSAADEPEPPPPPRP